MFASLPDDQPLAQSSMTHSHSLISVHLHAIFVAIVIAPFCHAFAIISASSLWYFAFKTE